MSDFTVKVDVVCDRTGKLEQKEMSISDAQKYNALKIQREEMAGEVASFLNGLPSDVRPDLVLSFRGKTVVMSTVVEKKADQGVLRVLHDLAPQAFPEVASTPRKKNANGGKSVTDTSDAG